MDIKGFLSLKQMLSPTLIKIIYASGVVASMLYLPLTLLDSLFILDTGLPELGNPVEVLLIFIFGNIFWRLFWEGTIILFAIHERLGVLGK